MLEVVYFRNGAILHFCLISDIFACVCQGITVDDKRIADINALADKLISQGRTDTNAVKEKRNYLNQK